MGYEGTSTTQEVISAPSESLEAVGARSARQHFEALAQGIMPELQRDPTFADRAER